MRRGIEPHIPVLDREHQTKGYFTRADFTFDATTNAFNCPAGKTLLSNGLVRDDGTMRVMACALQKQNPEKVKTDRADAESLPRVFMAWSRGERQACSVVLNQPRKRKI